MLNKENFHTHTTFCDGDSTPAQMVKAAVEKGFTALGFSGHSHFDFDCNWCMTEEGTQQYKAQIGALKKEYEGIIRIYCGTEHDALSTGTKHDDFDFTLGSVHYIPEHGALLAVDYSGQMQYDDAKKYYGGSMIRYAERYFEEETKILDDTNADFIGHFDLVTKFNENGELFDTSDSRYRNAWINAADRLLKFGRPFEINTGAIARKKRTTPYPSLEIADYIHSKGGYFILTSDCHSPAMLDCFFDEALEMYKKYNIVSFDEMLRNKGK